MSEVRIIGAESANGLELKTVGLAARGLPEVRMANLPPYLGDGWARVLGQVVLRLAASPTPPETIELAPGVEVGLAEAGEGHLTPVPPPGHEGALEDWRRDVLVRLFPEASR
ncbi:hypothetical protein [Spirillospora albida]|uniref:hypothetical protein n=1 Tax=Spirillospora albida TaxID=58123 RepID=UPI0004C07286|nr:hypothetical protein [Spirillospora albida]